MIRLATLLLLVSVWASPLQAGELAGITVPDQITLDNGTPLLLNGMGLREKLWIDVYVGSLYLPQRANNVADVLSQPGAYRIQLDIVYNEVSSEKMIAAWRDGFTKNQTEETLKALADKIERFYQFFEESAKKGDQYIFDYIPQVGVRFSKNGTQLGLIKGETFKSALIEIWLGNFPADKKLKKGMLGRT